jgi:acyl transferase domain-containing protein/3-hydroxymyristoyl/3-hydroxydecanoyl-(acyl carrier protein) dehydratase/NAD(P)-dependent dehydrogenase (short-subunit alcohol dehydrogenase family)/acyl carrier protein
MKPPPEKSVGIAIIGMGCIFPGSFNLKDFWHLLFNGIDAIEEIPDDTHWQLKQYFDQDPSRPDHVYCSRGGFLPKICFDPAAFGIPPNNITATDTSQLLGLEVAKMALEDAGYPKDHPFLSTAKVNVILGVTGTQELVIPLGARLGHPIWKNALDAAGIAPDQKEKILCHIQSSYAAWQENSFPGLLGNVVAGRIANRFNLSGTNSVSDAACASSLSALHSAVMELAAHKCDMSITGGVDCLNDIFMHMCFAKTGVLSHTSDARPFSKDADGTVLGEGIGMLVLKRLEDAQKDNDRIYAVIKGIGTSSDGKTSAIYAPEAEGQRKALQDAYHQANIDPTSIGLVEAHGTGTRVGDKVEFTALKSCFGTRAQKNHTAIGSVKSMIGHTKAAAGAAGIIKAALALHHKVIPPTLKADIPDPDLDITRSAFYLNHRSKPWVPGSDSTTPRRAGVSAFGFGGSNFHVVLEEYETKKARVSWNGSVQIAAFSAHDSQALLENLAAFGKHLAPEHPTDDGEIRRFIAWQACESRKSFRHDHPFRLLMVLHKDDDPAAQLATACDIVKKGTPTLGPVYYDAGPVKGKLGFLFPGQGSQYPDMGKELFAIFPEAMDALCLAQKIYNARVSDTGSRAQETRDLAELIFAPPPHFQDKSVSETRLRHTRAAQVAIGAVSLAMTRVLRRFKIKPHMTCGHSFGELAAMHAAGWMDGNTLLTLADVRGNHMANAGSTGSDSGSMLAVNAPLADIEALIRNLCLDLVLANRNSPNQGVLSGPTPDIDQAGQWCKTNKVRAVKLPVAAAFHTRLVADAAAPFSRFVADQAIVPTDIPVLSNTTGKLYDTDPDKISSLLGHQLMHPVCFQQNIETMHDHGVRFFIEAGPKTILTGLTKQILAPTPATAVSLDASCGKKSGISDLANVLCHLAARGFFVDLTQWEDPVDRPAPKRMRVLLSGANPKPQNPRDIQPVLQKGPDMHTPQSAPTQKPAPQATTTPARGSATPAQDAMFLVQKGLEAMQALQAQTARTHEKFLETQARAGQTLADMMAQTRRFIDTPVTMVEPDDTPAEPVASRTSQESPVPARVNGGTSPYKDAVVTISSAPKTRVPAPDSVQNDSQMPSSPAPDAPADSAVKTSDLSNVQSVLFDTVSRLTGFPVEMLEPDMDIESDLGIDSIKKVEIISELEKQLPDTRGLTFEHIGTARTLADICGTITSPAQNKASASPSAASIPVTAVTPEPAIKTKTAFAPSSTLNTLVETISELTGFPKDMLEPGMNLESDLGIDSIKRVEILSRLEQAMGERASGLSGEAMTQLKTIQDMACFLDQTQTPAESAVKKNPSHKDDLVKGRGEPVLVRQKIHLTQTAIQQIRFFNGARIQVSGTRKIYITRDQAGVAGLLQQAFQKQGLAVGLIDITSEKVPDLADAAGMVIVQDQWKPPHSADAIAFVKAAFALVHQNGSYLQAAAREKGAFLTTVSFSGGGFGIAPYTFDTHPVYGGLAGLAKTAALEWKEVLCHALDLPCDVTACNAHAEAAAALMMTRGPVEMGLNKDNCLVPTLADVPVKKGSLCLGHQDVVVITGGARGVTAACAVELASNCAPVIVLLGRSQVPFTEPEWAKSLSDPADLKKAILTHAFAGQKPTPADIEKQYQAICSNRQIRQTLAQIRSHGSQAIYLSTDIRHKKALQKTLDEVRTRFNAPITGIIHGAGVLEDKWIVDKQPDQFNRVFDTKVDGLNALVQTTQHDPLRYVIVFSSIAARFGNPGQCDYAMANEVLNKTMARLALEKPGCKCLSINWGPWDGGMVHDGLKQVFTKKGVGLIPMPDGARQLIREMADQDQDVTEIVITARIRDLKKKKPPVLSLVTRVAISRETVPIITAHKINHEPVVPFALLAEVLAHAVEKNNPGLVFSGLDDMRLLKGVRPKDHTISLEVNLGKCTQSETGYTALASLTSSHENKQTRTHATATAILQDKLPDPPVLSSWNRMDLAPCRRTIKEVYDTILFHGKDLQAITAINGIGANGIDVTATFAPAPAQWFQTPLQQHWVTDPMLLDAAFQAAILWTWETRGQVCLPSFFASLRIYSSLSRSRAHHGPEEPNPTESSPDNAIRILFTMNESTDHQVKGYFTFVDAHRTVVASITGFEAVVDPCLHEKFKPVPLFAKEAILAFAQGRPSDAFGPGYQMFDKDREIARLPRPPYFFMDRVLTADHVQWDMQPGGWIETAYDIPADAWYFKANHTRTMPFCILLEIALQPCGWLAAYAGSALHSDARLHFRNLGGSARLMGTVFTDSGTLTIRTRMTDVSKAGDMIIQEFAVQVSNRGRMIYQGTTSFGFFTGPALASQKGIRNSTLVADTASLSRESVKVFKAHSPLTPDDPAMGPDTGMPARALRMVDQIDIMNLAEGKNSSGYIRGKKKVDPKEWFFDAHFYQDPVCPGSLGIESFLQTLRFFLLEKYNIDPKTHAPQLILDQPHEWIYRGQIIPANQEITIHTHIRQVSEDADRYAVMADGALCVDGLPIYEMKNFGMAFVNTLFETSRDHRTRIFVPG